MRITELLNVPLYELETSPEIRMAQQWLSNAYTNAYRKGCSLHFTVPANDKDGDILNRELTAAIVGYAASVGGAGNRS